MSEEAATQRIAAIPEARTRIRTRTRHTPRRSRHITWYIGMGALACVFLTPALWGVSSSLKDIREVIAYPPQLIPSTVQWGNYVEIWRRVPLGRFVWNSVLLAGLGVIGQTISASAVAYGFSRFRFPGRNLLFLLLLSTLVLPQEVLMIPTFLMFNAVGWVDTFKPLIVPNFFGGGPGGAFFIFLLRQFFLTLPRELDEAAILDGASSWTIFWRIILPLSRPALGTVAILSFLYHWNDFLGPLIYLNSTEKFPLALGLRYFQQLPTEGGPPQQQLLMAAAVVMALPVIVLFLCAQRFFVQGIVSSGLKG